MNILVINCLVESNYTLNNSVSTHSSPTPTVTEPAAQVSHYGIITKINLAIVFKIF